MNHRIRFLFFGAGLCYALVGSPDASGQAYCALRDPVATIQKFTQTNSAHRSLVEMVGSSARGEISKKLPFTLHFNELGKHTLYVVLKDGKPDGFVHARSEKGKWGLVEIVWYMDLELKIRSFTYQRCRDGAKADVESPEFIKLVQGRDFDGIRELLIENGESIDRNKVRVPEKAEPLALATLRSALKTTLVTEIVWKDHIEKLRKEAGIKVKAAMQEGAIEVPHAEIYTASVIGTLAKIQQQEEWIINRKTVKVFKAEGKDGKKILLLRTQCTAEEEVVNLAWEVTGQGTISKVEPITGWPAPDVQEAFTGLETLTLEKIHNCSTPGQLAAAEVLAISQPHLRP